MGDQPTALHTFCTTSIGPTAQQRKFGYPSGDTPQPNGDILMSVIGGNWIVLFSPTGQTLRKAQAPIPDNGCQCVSDAQLLPDGDVLVADYAGPTQNAKSWCALTYALSPIYKCLGTVNKCAGTEVRSPGHVTERFSTSGGTPGVPIARGILRVQSVKFRTFSFLEGEGQGTLERPAGCRIVLDLNGLAAAGGG